MTELLMFAGTFAMVWLITWLVCSLVLLLCYPVFGQSLQRLHPAEASSLLLLVLAFPVLLSLVSTLLLFMPGLEGRLVSEHCHLNCQAHVPMIHSVGLATMGLFFLSAVLALLGTKLIFHLNMGRRLMSRLQTLASQKENYWLLEDDRPLVFILGWWRNRIFLTRGLLQHCTQTNLEIILAHEREHARRLDNVRLLLARLFLLVLPPGLARKLYADLHVFTESACDLVAAAGSSHLDVASTLLKVQRLAPSQFSYCDAPVASAFSGAEIEQRIKILLAQGSVVSTRQPIGARLCAVALLVCSVLLVDPLHHSVEMLLQLAGI